MRISAEAICNSSLIVFVASLAGADDHASAAMPDCYRYVSAARRARLRWR